MPQCNWFPQSGDRCQNEGTLKIYVKSVKCDCSACQGEVGTTFWICKRCVQLAPQHWKDYGVIAEF
jgi:hypothetical protein